METIAIIPARGGSKRIARKNVKDFFGKPIIAWAIETAINSGLFNEVMVSTEDAEIAQIAQKYGATVPFFRTGKNASDTAGTEDVIVEVLKCYEAIGKKFDIACCIYATSCLITPEILEKSKNKLILENFDTFFSVLKYAHPIQRALKTVNNRIIPVNPEQIDLRAQDLETRFHDAGQFYWFNVDKFLIHKQLFSENTGFIELSEFESQDIDVPEDWEMAMLKFKLKYKIE